MNKKEKNKQQKEKKKIGKLPIYQIILILLSFGLLVFLLVTNNNNLKEHCTNAICNEDNTICYNYSENKDGKTIKTWKGNCSVLK